MGFTNTIIDCKKSLRPLMAGSNEVNANESKICIGRGDAKTWTKKEIMLEAQDSDIDSRLQLTTSKKCIWLDQVSAMPLDTNVHYRMKVKSQGRMTLIMKV